MKRILLSLTLIVAIGTGVAGATRAFFSDTEASSGNIFVAGSIDLKVDNTLATYNGIGSMVIVSDGATQVDGHNAVPVIYHHIYWDAWTAVVPGAAWIWYTDPENSPPGDTQVKTFTRTFNWTGGPISNATLLVASDNTFSVDLNGGAFTATAPGNHYAAGTEKTYTVTGNIVPGLNTLTFVVTNEGCPVCQANPGGLMFRLQIDGQQTWANPVDLTGQKFFTFNDVKPGDYGTDVISLHVDSDDAYACLYTANPLDVPGPNGGNPSDYLNVVVWNDVNHDGIYQPATEGPTLYSGLLKSELTVPRLPITGGATGYLGLAWCMGNQTVNGDGSISCSGVGDQNTAQSAQFTADVVAYATQQRNNGSFQCSNIH